MALKFVSITQPTEDSEEVGVSFQLDSEYTGKPPLLHRASTGVYSSIRSP